MIKSIILQIRNYFLPQPPILGRWGSTLLNDNSQKIWLHDACTQDNCYLKIQNNNDEEKEKSKLNE